MIMDFFDVGDHITVKDLNAITYLLRKFKRLNTGLRLGSLSLESDYGSFVFDKPLTSVGGNFIIESEVNVSSSDCLKNCFYSFVFSVIDVNTSGTVNKRQVRVTGGTGDNGTLFITLPTDLIESDEVILPMFELDIVFDEHEYYTPVASIIKVSLTVDKTVVLEGETATVTAVLLDENNDPLVEVPCNFFVNGVMFTETTDSDGVAEYIYTGTGSDSTVVVRVIDKTVSFEDKSMSVVTAVFTGDSIQLGVNYDGESWLGSVGDVVIEWGDGSSDTVNNPTRSLIHSYTDGLSEHTVTFIGEVTSLGHDCFNNCSGLTSIEILSSVTSLGSDCFNNCSGLTSIEIPSSVTSLGDSCFYYCSGLTSVTIPNSVTSLGDYCFGRCFSLVDYQLYWRDTSIIGYDSDKMPVNTNTVFTIPYGQTSNYISKQYPSTKLTERSSGKTITTLSIQSSKASYYTDESITITGALIDEDNQPVTSASVKLYQNNQLIYTLTTDSSGNYSKILTGLSVGAYTFKAVYDGDSTYEASTSSNLNITVQNHTYSLSIASDKQSILTTESVTISGTLLKDSSAYGSQSVALYDGATVVDTLTTDGSGNYSKTLTGLSVGVHTFKAVNSNVESSTISITVNEPTHTYSLSIASDKSSILTTESVTISGQLLMDSSPYTGQSVALYDGSSLVDTLTTDSSGNYSKTVSGLSVGTHSFKAVNSNAESSTVSVTVTKITTTTSINASSSSILTTDTLTLTGSVTNVSTGSVKIYDGSTLVDEVSLSSGSYSKSLTGLSVGTHTYKAVYDGDTTHSGSESSTVTVTVSEPAPVHDYSLSVASTKDILSYADSESATITATLTDNGSAVSGETLSYTVKHGSTTIDSGSATTNSSGQISFNYTSSGVGDVTVEVDYGILLQETFVIEDCHYWNDGSSVGSLEIGTGVSCTSNGDYITITTSTSGEKYVYISKTLSSSDNWEYSVEIAEIGTTNSLAVNLANTNVYAGHVELQNNWFLNSRNFLTRATQVGDVGTFTKNGNNITATINNDGSDTQSVTFPSTYKVGFYTNNGRVQKIKNIKLKAL